MSVDAIREQALKLPPNERAELIDVLCDSLTPPELKSREKLWAEESERRIAALESERLKARDSDEVISELRKSLRR